MAIVDELEHGLEPHRIIRLIDALGAKERTRLFKRSSQPIRPLLCGS